MGLYEDLIAAMPELTEKDFAVDNGTISLRDDSDGKGAYIEKWDYEKPIPAGFKLGKDQAQSPKIMMNIKNERSHY